jgi:hypothetical protein
MHTQQVVVMGRSGPTTGVKFKKEKKKIKFRFSTYKGKYTQLKKIENSILYLFLSTQIHKLIKK